MFAHLSHDLCVKSILKISYLLTTDEEMTIKVQLIVKNSFSKKFVSRVSSENINGFV